MQAIVIRIPRWTRTFLSRLPNWKETSLEKRRRLASHSHGFLAVYFTFAVQHLESASGTRILPPAAMVIVPAGTVHGWTGTRDASAATVGHFHAGHPAHITEKASGAA